MRQWKTETKVGMFVIISLGIFAFILLQLGVFRLNVNKYRPYEICFEDVSGLSAKAFVKIAGVKVGWIEKISLLPDCAQARVTIMVKSRFQLHDDAYAIVRQEGIIGSRYLEIVPGTPSHALIAPGTRLNAPGHRQVSLETVLNQSQDIVDNIKAVTQSLGRALGGDEQAARLGCLIENLARASEHIAHFSESLNHLVSGNEQTLKKMVADCQVITNQAKELLPQLQNSIEQLSQRIDTNIEKVTQSLTNDINRVANKLEHTAQSIETAINQAHDGINNVTEIAQKINKGDGLLCKLINDDKVYDNIQAVSQTFRESIDRINSIGIEVDAHGEAMLKKNCDYCHHNNKGYMDMRISTNPNWFYKLGIVTSEKGWPERFYTCENYCNSNCQPIDPSSIVIDNGSVRVAPNINRMCIKRNNAKLDIQVGKVFYDNCTLRAGTFEGTFGVGFDWRLPIYSDTLQWITSLELFDLYGQNRYICDRSPHLKWLNRIYLFKNIYITVGADDFVSLNTRSWFFGAGLRFSDDDLKHVASHIGLFGSRN